MKKFFVLLNLTTLSIVAASKVESRLIGGSSALVGEYPFTAAIYITKPDGTYFCGGTLINDEWILTSGYCVYNAIRFRLQLGSYYLTTNDPNRVIVTTSEWHVPERFDSVTLVDDIGLIRLQNPVEFTDTVKQITYLSSFRISEGNPLTAIGWGQLSDADAALQEELQTVNMTTISTTECRAYYGERITEKIICLTGQSNQASCYGDIGSPLFRQITPDRYQIHGVASFISGNGCESLDPSGYTSTYRQLRFIFNVTGSTFGM